MARAPIPWRQATRHVRPGRVRRDHAPLCGSGVPVGWNGQLHAARISSLDRTKSRWPHLRTAPVCAQPARAYDSRVVGCIRLCPAGSASRRPIHDPYFCLYREAASRGPRAVHPLPCSYCIRAWRCARNNLAPSPREHLGRMYRHALISTLSISYKSRCAEIVQIDGSCPGNGHGCVARAPRRARCAAPPDPTISVASAASAPTGTRDAGCSRCSAKRGVQADQPGLARRLRARKSKRLRVFWCQTVIETLPPRRNSHSFGAYLVPSG